MTNYNSFIHANPPGPHWEFVPAPDDYNYGYWMRSDGVRIYAVRIHANAVHTNIGKGPVYATATVTMNVIDRKYPLEPVIPRRPIPSGTYGGIYYAGISKRGKAIVKVNGGMTADKLREAAHFFNQLAETLVKQEPVADDTPTQTARVTVGRAITEANFENVTVSFSKHLTIAATACLFKNCIIEGKREQFRYCHFDKCKFTEAALRADLDDIIAGKKFPPFPITVETGTSLIGNGQNLVDQAIGKSLSGFPSDTTSNKTFECERWPRCECPDGTYAKDCPAIERHAATVAGLKKFGYD